MNFLPLFSPDKPGPALRLLAALGAGLGDPLDPWRSRLQAGQAPEQVFTALGQSLKQTLHLQADRLAIYEQGLGTQQELRAVREQEIASLRKALDEQRHIQHRLERETETLRSRADDARKALERTSAAHRQTLEKLQAEVSRQQHIIAQQQLRLNQLLGDPTGAAPPGER